MEALALWAIKILRWAPFGPRFAVHLDRCAAWAVLYRPSEPHRPALNLAHVFGIEVVPKPSVKIDDAALPGIDFSMQGNNIGRGRTDPGAFEAVAQYRAKTIH